MKSWDLVIVACGDRKRDQPSPAGELYTGAYHRACLAYARTLVPDDRIRILSARYGLLRLDRVVEPYDRRLPTGQERHALQDAVLVQAFHAGLIPEPQRVAVLGGREYVEFARGVFGRDCTTGLLEGRGGIGKQLQWLRSVTQKGTTP